MDLLRKRGTFLSGQFAVRSFCAQVPLQGFLQRHCIVVFCLVRTVIRCLSFPDGLRWMAWYQLSAALMRRTGQYGSQ